MDRIDLSENFKKYLKPLSLEDFIKIFINYPQAVEEFYKLQHDIKAGNTISLLFNPHRLETNGIISDESIYSSLQKDNLLNGLSRLYLYNLEHNTNKPFYNAIQRGYNGVAYINEFPPFVARTIYKKYSKGNNIKILDPCSGWGGRMIAAASLKNVSYEGFEPSTKTFNGLNNLGEWLCTLESSFKYKIHKLPFEESSLDNKQFDIALTSPPYYDTEHYSDEETNSFNKFKTFESWIEGFYYPLIKKTLKYLKDDGVFIINIGMRKYPLDTYLYKICKENNFYIEKIEDYLSGHGKSKESFYLISKIKKLNKVKKLF